MIIRYIYNNNITLEEFVQYYRFALSFQMKGNSYYCSYTIY